MPMAQHNTIAQRLFIELFTQGRYAVADEIYAADHVSHDPTTPNVNGPAAMKELVKMYRAAFPDLQMTVEEVASEGDKALVRWTSRGTHQGMLRNIPPTGRRVTITGMNILHIVNGKIKEEWVNWDTMGLMQQIGVIPTQ